MVYIVSCTSKANTQIMICIPVGWYLEPCKKKNSQSENSEQSMEIILSFKDDTHIFKVY